MSRAGFATLLSGVPVALANRPIGFGVALVGGLVMLVQPTRSVFHATSTVHSERHRSEDVLTDYLRS
jgi:hypothetical protein